MENNNTTTNVFEISFVVQVPIIHTGLTSLARTLLIITGLYFGIEDLIHRQFWLIYFLRFSEDIFYIGRTLNIFKNLGILFLYTPKQKRI